MKTRTNGVVGGLMIVLSCSISGRAAPPSNPRTIRFDQEVRPILADRCFPCHGPDAETREADLRLDIESGAFAAVDDGMWAFRAGDLEHSAAFQRMTSSDEDERMPPSDSKLELSPNEIATIGTWIEQGAAWNQHWAFRPIQLPARPSVARSEWPRNDIDYFVLARLEASGIAQALPAARRQLIRRVTWDLTGLPPTPDETAAFLADDSDDAYELLVDRLLDSPRFGERMASDWLDLARYADTYGYQADVYRAVWPWRDWVVNAFNRNMPFDEFVTWQLAGDLLPNATQEQILATAFNRLHRQTNEGGSVEEEFRVAYVNDRVNTFATTMLGLTLQCARCHDHKFDPVTQHEYYELSSFFNNIDESGLYSHFTDAVPTPTLLLTDQSVRKKTEALDSQIEAAVLEYRELQAERIPQFALWLGKSRSTASVQPPIGDYSFDEIKDGHVANRREESTPGTLSESPQLVPGKSGHGLLLSGENNVSVPIGGNLTRNEPFSIAIWINTPDVKDRAVILHRSRAWTDAGSRGYQLLIEDGCLSASLIHFWPGNAIRIRASQPVAIGEWVHVVMSYDGSSRADGLKIYTNGRLADCTVVRDHLYKNITGGGATTLTVGQRFRDRGFKGGRVDELQIYDRCLVQLEVAQLYDESALEKLVRIPIGKLTEAQRKQWRDYYFARVDEQVSAAQKRLASLRLERHKCVDATPEIMVMCEMPKRRATYVLRRGVYSARAEQVAAGVPACLPPWPDGAPKNRLGLARWVTDPQHPLLARVTVNRLWQAVFSRGLVETAEDLGSQGASPSHPELLDWLARTFIESGWDVKSMMRRLVTSATYRQASTGVPVVIEDDPDNRLLARFPRHRLSAEMLRDGALYAGGLLVEKRGGPPVKPYQPEGLWREKSGKVYRRDVGEGSHRRSLYGYWKRTSPPPSMMIFDAAKRDVCVARRQQTATPLQALVLWNDPQYVEAARGLALRILSSGSPGEPAEQAARAFLWLTGRPPEPDERVILEQLYREQFEYFQKRPDETTAFLSIGDLKVPEKIDQKRLAALSAVTQTLLSYDETITVR